MKQRTMKRAASALAAVAVVAAASGCSNKAQDSGGSSSASGGAAADVQTDFGVEGNTINLGVLTDLTGVFAALGKDITNANTMYWKDNKVCDKYDVKLNVQDTGYVPQTGVQLYSGMKDSILAMQQTIGSPINTALAPAYTADKMVNFPSAWAQTLTEIPGTGVVGATYAVEIANGYDYMFQQGLLKEGDTVGHIYFEGEYGANGLAGTQAVAKVKNLKVVEAKIKSTDQDMSSQITQFKAAGVKMVALTVAPTQLASAASAMEAQGLDVPILGSDPVFAPGLLQGPSANKIKKDLYVASPVSAFDQHQDLLQQYQAAYPDSTPSLGVLVGVGMSELMKQVLDSACKNGDLTHQGVLDAFNGLQNVDTNDVVVPIRGFAAGKSPSLQSFVLQPADVPGGAKVVADAFEGQFAAAIAG
jgi:ABC-type branched-subunit amino acid transport system substrate-binding protein